MSIKTRVEILGIKYHLGIGFLNEMINGTGKTLEELAVLPEVTLVPTLMYYSRLYADIREGVQPDYTLRDIYDYIDDNGGMAGQFYKDFYTAYIKAMTQDVPAEDSKKKAGAKK